MTARAVIDLVDDDKAARDSLAFMLEAAGHEVRCWPSASAFLAGGPNEPADCILTDIRMPEMNGLELVRHLKAHDRCEAIIVITGHADVPLAVEAMKAGVADFIEKPVDRYRLLGAIKAALNRPPPKSPVDSEEARRICGRLAALSGREREVLDGLVAGRPNKIIAHDLGISPRTVEVYRAKLMTKMRAHSLSELVQLVLLADPGAVARHRP